MKLTYKVLFLVGTIVWMLSACGVASRSPDLLEPVNTQPTTVLPLEENPTPTPTSMPQPTKTPLPSPTSTTIPASTRQPIEEAAIKSVRVTVEPNDGAFTLNKRQDSEDSETETFTPLKTGPFTLVSISSEGVPGDGQAQNFTISEDGRFIIFSSTSRNLVPSDPNGRTADVYIHDRYTGETNVMLTGGKPLIIRYDNKISSIAMTPTGDVMVLVAGENTIRDDVYLVDMASLEFENITQPAVLNDQASRQRNRCPAISADGRFITFKSTTNDLIQGVTSNKEQVYLYDRETDRMRLVSRSPSGEPGDGRSVCPAISADGSKIVFTSFARNLAPPSNKCQGPFCTGEGMFIYDIATDQLARLDDEKGDQSHPPSISHNGERIAYQYLSNDKEIYVKDIVTNQEWAITLQETIYDSRRTLHDLAISHDGRFVFFWATSPTPEHAWIFFHYDLEENQLIELHAHEGNNINMWLPTTSADNKFVVFGSTAPLVEGISKAGWNENYLYVFEVP